MSWFDYIAARLGADLDWTLVEKQLALTPTERLEKLEAMRAFSREAEKARVQAAHRRAR